MKLSKESLLIIISFIVIIPLLTTLNSCPLAPTETSEVTEETTREIAESLQEEKIFFQYPFIDYPIGKQTDDGLYWDCSDNDFGAYLGTWGGKVYNGFHSGEDWNLKGGKDGNIDLGEKVYAIGEGKVVKISKLIGNSGWLVAIKHEGSFIIPDHEKAWYKREEINTVYSVYEHLKAIEVKENDDVDENSIIGYIMDPGGGPHLHLEIRLDDEHKKNWSSDWSLVDYRDGGYQKKNAYFIDLQKMIGAGLRDPSDFIEANSKISITVSEEHEEELLEENSKTEIGRIVFESWRDGNWEIYVMNADGSGQTNLTNSPAADFDPVWSPDGTRIAFVSWRDGKPEIYVMNSDGSKQINLTNNPAADGSPAWSPDGKKIAFDSDRDSYSEIYVMNSDGSGQTNLTNSKRYNYYPVWSPDGKKIAFLSHFDIYVMNSDGSGQINLTNSPADDFSPTWSPDGKKIAFESKGEIYVMNSDGSGQINLTNSPADDGYPDWSPDGKKIAFASYHYGNHEIYVMNADGSGQTNLTNSPGFDFEPLWSPNGNKIFFESKRDRDLEIYVMNADGSGQTNLTNSKGYDRWSLNYSTYGKMISF